MRGTGKEMKNTIENLTKKVSYVVAAFFLFIENDLYDVLRRRELKEYKELEFKKKFF
jgi:hypothetical protein